MKQDIESISSFIFAGKATFTLENTETGNRFTYKFSETDTGGAFFASVLTGPDNWSNYTYAGMAFPDGGLRQTKGSKVSPEAQSWKVLVWFMHHIKSDRSLPEQVRFHHEGKCGRCGRKLTVPESIESGLGPVCATRS